MTTPPFKAIEHSVKREDVESDEFTAQYIAYRIHAQFRLTTDANAAGIILYSLITALIDPFVGRPEAQVWLRVLRLASILASLGYFFISKRAPTIGRYLVITIHFFLVLAYALLMRAQILDGNTARVAISASAVLPQIFFMIIMCPVTEVGAAFVAMLYLSTVVFACSANFPDCWRIIVVAAGLIVLALSFQHNLITTTKRLARAELAGRLKMAPHDLVRRSIALASDISEALAPKRCWCICLASDWRGYQSICRERPPEEVAGALAAYYEACRHLLKSHFPAGNYYSDWIADELLIFFFPENAANDEADSTLVGAVLAFARALTGAKARHQIQVGLPRAIDIGLAAGPAIIGLAGPETNRKMMAIGAVPVTARKMQSLGKYLRQDAGERDRIIYPAAMTVTPTTQTRTVRVPEAIEATLPEALRMDPLVYEEPDESSVKKAS